MNQDGAEGPGGARKAKPVLLVVVGLILLAAAFGIGFKTGQGWRQAEVDANTARAEAQVRFLLNLAYPQQTDPKGSDPVVDNIPPGPLMKEIQQYKNTPDVVRSILVDQVSKELKEWQTQPRPSTKSTWWDKSYLSGYNEYVRRCDALRRWVPDSMPAKNDAR